MPLRNPLSQFISEIFMANLEAKLTSVDRMPRFWRRYVDDICTAIKKNYVKKTADFLNKFYPSIEVTLDMEKEGQLPL